MSDFAPGDVVVCVDDSPFPKGQNPPKSIRRGSVYRVDGIFESPTTGSPCITLIGVNPDTSNGMFGAWRFRKIDPADEPFAEQIRACRPIKTKVDA